LFVNRRRELASLEEHYRSERAELYVLYGRRRVGKTELLQTFCQEKRHLFFVADLGTEASLLAEFTRVISAFAQGDSDLLAPFASWDTAFAFLARFAATERLVLVLDEFTYLIRANPALPSILQRLWDRRLRETRLMLVLCGSYVGMMEKHVLTYEAPLYGRRSAQWQMQPLGFHDAALFHPRYDASNHVYAFGILGGVPAYLLQFGEGDSVLDNVQRRVLTQGAFLYDEPRFLLLEELHEPSRHFAILEAIAAGHTRPNEIAQAVGLAATSLPSYLDTLRALGLVEREVPATETQPHKSKRGRYRILDHYFRFWFRFVAPHRSLLERGDTAPVAQLIQEQIDQFTGPVFEAVCREHVWRLAREGLLGFLPQSVGRWWDDHDEIDVVAVGDQQALLGECKWTTRSVGVNVLDELRRKAQPLVARQGWQHVTYMLFARAGFTPALRDDAARDGVVLVDLAGLAP
jgi:AAA+ ATPase superfamily predicted ATPase